MDPEQRQPISVPGENELPVQQEMTIQELQQTLAELRITQEELRVAEEELRRQNSQLESERLKYEDLFNCAPDGYLVTTLTGMVQSANLAIAAQLAVTPDFLIDKPFVRFVAEPDRAAFYTQLHQQRLPSQQPSPTNSPPSSPLGK
jgi:PAS domain-containing protein